MKLKNWRALKGLSLGAVARGTGAASAKVVQRWEEHEAIPRKAAMQRLFVFSEGAVTPNDFYDLPANQGRAA